MREVWFYSEIEIVFTENWFSVLVEEKGEKWLDRGREGEVDMRRRVEFCSQSNQCTEGLHFSIPAYRFIRPGICRHLFGALLLLTVSFETKMVLKFYLLCLGSSREEEGSILLRIPASPPQKTEISPFWIGAELIVFDLFCFCCEFV